MKKLSSASLFIVLLLVAYSSVNAQGIKEIKSPQARAKETVLKFYSGCTNTQASSLHFVYADYYAKYDAAVKAPRPSKAEYEHKLKMLKENLESKVQAMLTPQQIQMSIACNNEVVEP